MSRITRSRSASICLVGAAAMIFATTAGSMLGCAPTEDAAPSIRVTVTTPSGEVLDTYGDPAEFVAPLIEALPRPVIADGVSTQDPGALVTSEHVELTLQNGEDATLTRDGTAIVLRTGDETRPVARFIVDPTATTLDLELSGQLYRVATSGVAAGDATDYLGGFLFHFLEGSGLDHIAGIEEAHAILIPILVGIIIIELIIIVGQVKNYASMNECLANQPGRCTQDAVAACTQGGYDWASAEWSCICDWWCAFALGDVDAGCKISCGNNEEEVEEQLEPEENQAPDDDADPTPDPSPDPTPDPSPDPSPTPDPSPDPSPTPDPSPSPSPDPDPSSTPEP